MDIFPTSLRTLQVVNVRWFNATAWYGLTLARLLNDIGCRSKVVVLADTEPHVKAVEMGLDPVFLPLNTTNPLHYPGLFQKLHQLVDDFHPHIVNCHRGEGFFFWGLLKKQGGYALVRTRGDQRLPKGNLPNRWLHSRVADAVVATNSRMYRYFENFMGVPEERLHFVPGGVDLQRFQFDAAGREAVRKQYGFTPEHCVLGLLGRFDRVKGQKELIRAVHHLVQAGLDNVRLLLIGFPTATLQEEVEAWIHEEHMERHVTITGRVADVTACISALDIGVIPSLWSESIARAALEIMGCGRPLIATSVGVMPDLLPVSALVEPGDEDALERLLLRAVKDASWREELAAENKRRISLLGNKDFLEQSLAVYANALYQRGL